MTDTNIKYYLIPGLGCLDPVKDLPYQYRVAVIPDSFTFIPEKLNGYESLSHLRRYDKTWKDFNSSNPKGAIKICEKRFLLDFNDFVLTPSNPIFDKYSYKILMHSVFGEFDKDLNGIHLLSKHNKNLTIEKITKNEDTNLVWEALIKVFNEERGKYYTKISTFFPKFWTPSHFMFETFYAFIKIYAPDINGIVESNTKSGIPVNFVFKFGELKSVFPIHNKQ